MGLDMYLTGDKFLPTQYDKDDNALPSLEMDGFRVKSHQLELGYWRKHSDLHGYIVETFADGVDECQDIELGKADLRTIIVYLKGGGKLPHTTGFFFGASDNTPEEREADTAVFQKALDWLSAEDGSWKSVEYRASW